MIKNVLYLSVIIAILYLISRCDGCPDIDYISEKIKIDFPSSAKIEFCRKEGSLTSNFLYLKVRMDVADGLHFLRQGYFKLFYTSKERKHIFHNLKSEYKEWNPDSVRHSIFGMFTNESESHPLFVEYLFDISNLPALSSCVSNIDGLIFPDEINRCLNLNNIYHNKIQKIDYYFCIIE